MAYTQSDLDAIRATIAKGELRVDFSDRSITYRSIDELLKAEARITTALTSGRPKQSFGVATKGV
jgi:hypothetical protein